MGVGVMELERPEVESKQLDYETRRYNDTVTWLAEVLPGAMRSPFEFTYDGNELYASDGGAMGPVFEDSIEQSRNLPDHLQFEHRRNVIEGEEYQDILAMMRGERSNTMVVQSDFPPELMEAVEDVGGYNVKRKPTMLRVIIRTPQDTLKMYSQTLDGSNRKALEAMRASMGYGTASGELLGQRMFADLDPFQQEFLVDHLQQVYDNSLQEQFGGEWHAGRQGEPRENTYDFVRQQSDLLRTYLTITDSFTAGEAEYNLAAAMKQRYLDGYSFDEYVESGIDETEEFLRAIAEMGGAGRAAAARGEVFSGCGDTLKKQYESALEEQLALMGYGSKSEQEPGSSEKLVWKVGLCRIENCPTRPARTKIAQCQVCRCCQYLYDRGRNPSILYGKPDRASFWSIIANSFFKEDSKENE